MAWLNYFFDCNQLEFNLRIGCRKIIHLLLCQIVAITSFRDGPMKAAPNTAIKPIPQRLGAL